jgi:hypothetical protein
VLRVFIAAPYCAATAGSPPDTRRGIESGSQLASAVNIAIEPSELRLVRRPQAANHREVLDVQGRKLEIVLFRGRGDDQIGRGDARVTASKPSPEIAGAASNRLINEEPGDRREKALSGSALVASESAQDLDPGDLRTARRLGQSSRVGDRRWMPTQEIDHDGGIPQGAHRRRCSSSSSRRSSRARRASTYERPSGRTTGESSSASTAAWNAASLPSSPSDADKYVSIASRMTVDFVVPSALARVARRRSWSASR